MRLLATFAVLVAACGGELEGQLVVRDARMPAPTGLTSAAAYFTIVNGTDSTDTLISVASDIAGRASVHWSVREGARVRMQPMSRLAIPARDTVRLAPGGVHVMLLYLSRRPAPGDTVMLELTFARAAPVTLRVPVVRYEDVEQ